MGTVAVDSSVVIALLDPKDAHHEAAVRVVRRRREAGDALSLSAVALAECLVGAARGGSAEADQVANRLARVFGTARPTDETVAREAAALQARHRWLRLPDALVLATASVDGCEAVLTSDRRWAKVLPAVLVVGVGRSAGPDVGQRTRVVQVEVEPVRPPVHRHGVTGVQDAHRATLRLGEGQRLVHAKPGVVVDPVRSGR